MNKKVNFLLLLILILSPIIVFSYTTRDCAVLISVSIDSTVTPNIIRLVWDNSDTNAKSFYISRKNLNDNTFTLIDTIGAPANIYYDTVSTNDYKYEYQVIKSTLGNDYWGFGYVYVAKDLPSPVFRGKLLLIVDETMSVPLVNEINGYIEDLTGDGWLVKKYDVPRTEIFNRFAVQRVKSIIDKEYLESENELNTVILFGRVAVPYSGNTAFDSHANHSGAWPADIYYSSINGFWTDSDVNNTTPEREENKNLPHDGKYDQSTIMRDAVLRLGRIDLFNLPSFSESETELLRNYLVKNHRFRHTLYKPPMKALIDDGFGLYAGDAIASSAWMNFASLLGFNNIDSASFRYDLREKDYLFGYGCNSGAYDNCMITAYTDELAKFNYNTVFTMFLGSYNGDYDSKDNLLRAAIASKPGILTCIWNGRPYLFIHQMCLGEPIGNSVLLSQNNLNTYIGTSSKGKKGIHVTLMGDPTLRIKYIEPPKNPSLLSDTIKNGVRKIRIIWNRSNESILGYNIYRTNSLENKFTRLNLSPVSDTLFEDSGHNGGNTIYMVRAIKKEYANTGSYYNESQGAFLFLSLPVGVDEMTLIKNNFDVFPNPAKEEFKIRFNIEKSQRISFELCEPSGKLIKQLGTAFYNTGEYNLNFIPDVPTGLYFLKMIEENNIKVAKISIIH